MSDTPLTYWKALHQFCNRAGADDVVNNTPSSYQQLSEEDRQFLTKAMEEFVEGSDYVRKMKVDVETLTTLNLKSPTDAERATALATIEHLCDLCDDIDVAGDFYKVGVFRIIVPLLCSQSAPLRAATCNLMAKLSQNNPFIQELMIDNDAMTILLNLMQNDVDNTVRTKALYAIASMFRSNDKATKAFIDQKGITAVVHTLQKMLTHDTFVAKAAFLLYLIAEHQPDKLTADVWPCCVTILTQSDLDVLSEQAIEHLLRLMLNMRALANPSLVVLDAHNTTLLTTRLTALKCNTDMYEEIRMDAGELLEKIA